MTMVTASWMTLRTMTGMVSAMKKMRTTMETASGMLTRKMSKKRRKRMSYKIVRHYLYCKI